MLGSYTSIRIAPGLSGTFNGSVKYNVNQAHIRRQRRVCLEYILASTKKEGRMIFHRGDVAEGKLNVPAASIYHVKNGTDIAREYIDRLTIFNQLGVDPQAAASSSDPA